MFPLTDLTALVYRETTILSGRSDPDPQELPRLMQGSSSSFSSEGVTHTINSVAEIAGGNSPGIREFR